MKSFGSMTADELAAFRGTVYGARCRIHFPGASPYTSDIEEPSEGLLDETLGMIRARGYVIRFTRYYYERGEPARDRRKREHGCQDFRCVKCDTENLQALSA